jgi:clan AA aspartic protease (TIGR02281 family)
MVSLIFILTTMFSILKRLWSIGAIATIMTVFSPVVEAQEQQGCFMLDAQNRPISLGNLCPSKSINFNATDRASRVFEVPIKRRKNGIPVIEVRFNNRYTFDMMLDTGASVIAVTPEIAEVLGLKIEKTVPVSTPSDDSVEMPLSKVSSVSVGNLTANNLEALIANSLDIGLLGQNFFDGYDITIKRNSIEFRPHP